MALYRCTSHRSMVTTRSRAASTVVRQAPLPPLRARRRISLPFLLLRAVPPARDHRDRRPRYSYCLHVQLRSCTVHVYRGTGTVSTCIIHYTVLIVRFAVRRQLCRSNSGHFTLPQSGHFAATCVAVCPPPPFVIDTSCTPYGTRLYCTAARPPERAPAARRMIWRRTRPARPALLPRLCPPRAAPARTTQS